MRKASILLLPCLVGGALLAGCGGGDSSDSTATQAALSKSEYVKQGNAICKKANDEINAAVKKQFGNQQPSKEQVTKFVNDTAIPAIEDEIAQLRALPAPSGDEDTVNAIYDAAQQGVDEAKQDPTSLVSDNSSNFAKADKLAKDYGLDVCAS